jgi:hypothetical protein
MSVKWNFLQVPATGYMAYQALPVSTTTTNHLAYQASRATSYQPL